MQYVQYGYGYVTVVAEYGQDISAMMDLNISGLRDRMIRTLPFSFSSLDNSHVGVCIDFSRYT